MERAFLIKLVAFVVLSDHTHLDLDIIEDEEGVQGLYWCVDYPWPLSDRDVSCSSFITALGCVCLCVRV